MNGGKSYPKRAISRFLIVAAILALPLVGWLAGHVFSRIRVRTTNSADKESVFRVAGHSMAPTLLGPAAKVNCENCNAEIVFGWSYESTQKAFLCSFCGTEHIAADLANESKLQQLEGDLIQVEPLTGPLEFGELIAIRGDDIPRVKRVVGLPGDKITLADGRLLVNGSRIEDHLFRLQRHQTLSVDDDALKKPTRWKPIDLGKSKDSVSQWLAYNHINVHDHSVASGVMDDYQYNVAVSRHLNEVDRLGVEIKLRNADTTSIEVAFWSPNMNSLVKRDVETGRLLNVCVLDGTPMQDLPVSKERPIAIRLQSKTAEFSVLRVYRFVEYRSRNNDLRQFPLTLGTEQCFVVGDNVPISIDCRQNGPLPINDILGSVKPKLPSR